MKTPHQELGMTSELNEASDAVLARLRAAAEAPNSRGQNPLIARDRINGIQRAREYLTDRSHRIVFVGEIGRGKSSMIAMLSQLVWGDAPKDRKSLQERSVLTVGSGGTTVCEVRIRAATSRDSHPYGLMIDPFSVEEMRREIRFFAHDEWERIHEPERVRTDESRGATPREVQRVIRNMTGLAVRSESTTENGQPRRRTIDPLDDIIKTHDSKGSLANYLIEHANLLSRTETSWFWAEGSDVLAEMKRWFDDINHGRAPTAMLPRSMTLVVPEPLPGLRGPVDVELIDSRGLDGRIGGRPDIQKLLRDPRTLVVLCAPFREAPGEAVRGLLRDMKSDAELSQAAGRTLMVLLDHGDSEGVNEAGGDRKFGQELRLRECSRNLQMEGLEAFAAVNQMVAYDVLQDDRASLVSVLSARIDAMRETMRNLLRERVLDADSFLRDVENERVERARANVDKRLVTTLEANRLQGAPMSDPLQGLYDDIRDCRYASRVYASCRRNGDYSSMDAYSAVHSGASRAATAWLQNLDAVVRGEFNTLEHDTEFADVLNHIRLRRQQYEDHRIEFISKYATSVQEEIEKALFEDGHVWKACEREWGGGPGFKDRVVQHLMRWSAAHASLCAHKTELSRMLTASLGSLARSADADRRS